MRTQLWSLILLSWSVGCTSPSPTLKTTPKPPVTTSPQAPSPSSPTPTTSIAYDEARYHLSVAHHEAVAQTPSERLGPLWVLPTHHEVWHTHGGDAAWIYSLSCALQNVTSKPVSVEVMSVELLIGHCVQPGWFSRTPLALQKMEWSSDPSQKTGKSQGAKHHIAPDQAAYAQLTYKPVSVYNACERFAYGVKLLVDGAPQTLELPLNVVREEPYDPDL